MSHWRWKASRKVAHVVISLTTSIAMTLTLTPAVIAEPAPTITDSSSSSASTSSKKSWFDGLKKKSETPAPSTVTSINHLKDLFSPPARSITTTTPEDENANSEGRSTRRDKDGKIVYSGKHTEQSAAEAQGYYCETSDDLTFGGIAHLVEDEMRKLIPDEQGKKNFDRLAVELDRAMSYVALPAILVSTPSTQITGPAREIDDHAVNYVVGALLKARDGGWRSTIAVQDITINEAIESVLWWFYWAAIYGEWNDETTPNIISFVILGIDFGLTEYYNKFWAKVPDLMLKLGRFIQKQLQTNCLVKKDSRSHPGNLQYHDIPEWAPKDFRDGVRQLERPIDNIEVADEDCPPISEMTYRRIAQRTALLNRRNVKPQYRELYDETVKFALSRMEEIKINKALIPLKASEIGGIIGLINDPMVTYVYGVGTAIPDGRVLQWVPLGDVTVDNTFDIAIVANEFSRIVASLMWTIYRSIMNAIINASLNSIDKQIRKAISGALLKTIPTEGLGSRACQTIVQTIVTAAVAGGSGGAAAPAALPEGYIAAAIACGLVNSLANTPGEDSTTFLPGPVFSFRIFPLPGIDFGFVIPWFGSIPTGLPNPTDPLDPTGMQLGDVPVFGNLFKKSKYLKLITILGLTWDLWFNPVPTMFFFGDHIVPIGQGVTQSICLAEDKGHRNAKWERGEDQIKEDADLAEKKGMYKAPKGPNIILFNKWVLPFTNPFFKPDYKNLNEDVPEREPLYQRRDPSRVPDQLDPYDPTYTERVTPTPRKKYQITYDREPEYEKADRKVKEAQQQPQQ